MSHPASQVCVRHDLAITWLGHSSVLIELDGVRLVTDPVLRDRIGPLVRVAPAVTAGALDGLDAILLSHLHADHADLPSLKRVGNGAVVLSPYQAEAWLRSRGVAGARGLRPADATNVGPVKVAAMGAIHDRRRWRFGPSADPIGFVISGSRSVYFPGDTDLDPAMADLRGSIDVALVPIWGWGRSVGAGHLDPARAALAMALIAPTVAIPIHWGTFRLRLFAGRSRDLQRPVVEFAELAKRHAPGVEVHVLAPGERIDI